MELDEKRIDYEKFKALQSHSAHQQVLLHQLRNRLEEHEDDQDQELKEKLCTIEDLHHRLKANVDSVHTLNQQLNSHQKENVRLRADLEREITSRQTLKLQVDTKEQMILSLKAAMETRIHHASLPDTYLKTPLIMDSLHRTPVKDIRHSHGAKTTDWCGRSSGFVPHVMYPHHTHQCSTYTPHANMPDPYKHATEESGLSDPQAMDKNYWISRVGELSLQLQTSSEYWSDKVRDLSHQLDVTKSPLPPQSS
jgi:hypothetical protein